LRLSLTKNELVQKVCRLKTEIEWNNYDHLVVVIMSHGHRGTFQTSNARDPTNSDAAFRRIHQLTETLSRIPGLAGKPKILLINTCRGDIPNYI
jgi:hypothetical protein